MRGPAHYTAAEDLMSDAETSLDPDVDHLLLAAQVHATLAVAVAVVVVAVVAVVVAVAVVAAQVIL